MCWRRSSSSGLKTYYKEVCLLDQVSIHPDHGGKTVAQAVKEHEGKAGAPIAIKGFVRYALGEGIEKADQRFRGGSRGGRQGLISPRSADRRDEQKRAKRATGRFAPFFRAWPASTEAGHADSIRTG